MATAIATPLAGTTAATATEAPALPVRLAGGLAAMGPFVRTRRLGRCAVSIVAEVVLRPRERTRTLLVMAARMMTVGTGAIGVRGLPVMTVCMMAAGVMSAGVMSAGAMALRAATRRLRRPLAILTLAGFGLRAARCEALRTLAAMRRLGPAGTLAVAPFRTLVASTTPLASTARNWAS